MASRAWLWEPASASMSEPVQSSKSPAQGMITLYVLSRLRGSDYRQAIICKYVAPCSPICHPPLPFRPDGPTHGQCAHVNRTKPSIHLCDQAHQEAQTGSSRATELFKDANSFNHHLLRYQRGHTRLQGAHSAANTQL